MGVAVTDGVGLTTILKLTGVTVQVPATGIKVITAVSDAIPVLVAENAAILSVPPAGMPMVVFVLVHVTVAVLTASKKLTAVTVAPLHVTISAGIGMTGEGATVMENICAVPGHVAAVGVTVIDDVTVTELLFTAVNGEMLPVPEACSPIVVSALAQEKTVPATSPVKIKPDVVTPLQKVSLGIVVILGVGSTVMLKVSDPPGQVVVVGVMVKPAVTGTKLVLIAVKVPMLPEPDANVPIAGFELTQLNEVAGTEL